MHVWEGEAVFTSCSLLLEESSVAAWNFTQAVRPLCRPCSRQEPLCSRCTRPTITLFMDVTACIAQHSMNPKSSESRVECPKLMSADYTQLQGWIIACESRGQSDLTIAEAVLSPTSTAIKKFGAPQFRQSAFALHNGRTNM